MYLPVLCPALIRAVGIPCHLLLPCGSQESERQGENGVGRAKRMNGLPTEGLLFHAAAAGAAGAGAAAASIRLLLLLFFLHLAAAAVIVLLTGGDAAKTRWEKKRLSFRAGDLLLRLLLLLPLLLQPLLLLAHVPLPPPPPPPPPPLLLSMACATPTRECHGPFSGVAAACSRGLNLAAAVRESCRSQVGALGDAVDLYGQGVLPAPLVVAFEELWRWFCVVMPTR